MFFEFCLWIKELLWIDGSVCVAVPPEWLDNCLLLLIATKIQIRNRVLPQPPLVSSEVCMKVEFDQGKVGNDKRVVIQYSVGRVCKYPFVTSEKTATFGGYQRLCGTSHKKYQSYLGSFILKILQTIVLSAVSMKKSSFGNWCIKVQAKANRVLVCGWQGSQRFEWRSEWRNAAKNFTAD